MAKLGNLSDLAALASVAKQKKESVNKREVLTVPLDKVISKEQVRTNFDLAKLEELGDSMLVEGQQSPIIVSPVNSDGKYVIQKGERRWRACGIKGISEVDIIVNSKEQSDLDETAGELIENIQREDLTALEIAKALVKFVDYGWSQQDIAKRIGKSKVFVSQHLALNKLPTHVMELYEAGKTEGVESLNNLRTLDKLNTDLCKKICESGLTEHDGVSRESTRKYLREQKNIKDMPACVVKLAERQPLIEFDVLSNLTQLYQLSDDTCKDLCELAVKNGISRKQSESVLRDAQRKVASQLSKKNITENTNTNTTETFAQNDSSEELTDSNTFTQEEPPEVKVPEIQQDNSVTEQSESSSSSVNKAKEWKEVSEQIITVRVIGENSHSHGVLMTDRVSLEPQYVWVKMLDKKKQSKAHKVAVSDIELVSVE